LNRSAALAAVGIAVTSPTQDLWVPNPSGLSIASRALVSAQTAPAALLLAGWLLDRPDSPWYPKVRLFRQSWPGDWQRVFEQIAAALERLKARS
jgi:hypothetical protein